VTRGEDAALLEEAPSRDSEESCWSRALSFHISATYITIDAGSDDKIQIHLSPCHSPSPIQLTSSRSLHFLHRGRDFLALPPSILPVSRPPLGPLPYPPVWRIRTSLTVTMTDFDPNVDYYAPSLEARFNIRRHRSFEDLGASQGQQTPLPTADIQWTPDKFKFRERASQLLAADARRPARLPKGWPACLDHPLAWHGDDLSPDAYTYTLSVEERGELHAALERFKGAGGPPLASSPLLPPFRPALCSPRANDTTTTALNADLKDIDKASFPLQGLGRTLETLRSRVLDGHGFVVIRGHDPSSYSREDNAIIHMGVSIWFGDRFGRQAQDGQLMGRCPSLICVKDELTFSRPCRRRQARGRRR
jgi:hypothetical protein